MRTPLSPAIKGVITALVMIGATLLIDHYRQEVDPRIQYFVYVIYLAGIIWSILPYSGSFGELFNQGFRCFIVVTILMVGFTFVFVKLHPEWAEQKSASTIEYYKAQGDKTPMELQEIGKKAKKQYPTSEVSFSIFRYLMIGAALTAGTAAVLNRKN